MILSIIFLVLNTIVGFLDICSGLINIIEGNNASACINFGVGGLAFSAVLIISIALYLELKCK